MLLGLGARATNAVQTALIVLAILFVLRLVCRRTWLAAGVLAVLLATLGGWGEHPLLDAFAVLGAVVPIAWIAARWGLVSLFALVLVRSLLTTLPLPLDADLWYTVYALASLGAAAALVAYAFRVALGAHRPAGA